MVRRRAVRGGQRGGAGGRGQEAGDQEGAVRRREGRAPLQGGGPRLHPLLHRAPRLPVQGRGTRAAQPPRSRRRLLPLRPRLRLSPSPRRRHRRHRHHSGRLRRARRRAGLHRRCSWRRSRRPLRRRSPPRRAAGIGLSVNKMLAIY